MALGKVQVNNLNLNQGQLPDIERYFLFVGLCATNAGQLLTVTPDTDLDEVLGAETSLLKTQVEAAKLNAGQNWSAAVYPLAEAATWEDAVDAAMEETSVEAVVVVDPVQSAVELEAMQAKAAEIMGKYMRPLFFMAYTRAIDPAPDTGEDWASYVADIKALTDGIAANQVLIVPQLWGHELGTLAGRLCDRSVTVADSPMRVNTGALVGEWSQRPVDNTGRKLDMAILQDLDRARFSVPQWYPDYPGMYWGDGNMLDVPGGDYQVVENLRVVQKAMRKVYPLAVARIADRRLNSTPASIAQNSTYFMRPLREMSHSVNILGQTFPGEVKPPQDGDISITWPTRTAVELYMVVRPYNCPKSITCNILLDLTNYGAEA
ncbi:DUF2586 domain-containing protein [Desulfobaculum senezii]